MATTNLNIRIDKAIKDQAEEIFNELGLNMTTAINIFYTFIIAHSYMSDLLNTIFIVIKINSF